MILEGLLQDFSIVELLQLIAMGRKTGLLEIDEDSDKNKANVFIQKGIVSHIRLKKNVVPINVMLIKAGLITAEQAKFAHKYQQEMINKERYGAVLLKLNYISRHNLRKVIQEQMEEALYSLFDWQKGSFRFYDSGELELADFPLNMSIENLILEGSRRQDEWVRILTVVPHLDVKFRFKPQEDGSQFLDLAPEEWEIMTNIDDQSSARELAMRLGLSNFSTCTILSNLIKKSVIEINPDSGKEGDAGDKSK